MPARQVVCSLALVAVSGCERIDPYPVVPPALAPPAPTALRTTEVAHEHAPAAIPFLPQRRPMTRTKRWFLGLSQEGRDGVQKLCRLRRENPCAGMLAPPRGQADPADGLLAALSVEQRDGVDSYCSEHGAGICDTPLVVAFASQPVAFSTNTSTFAFTPGEPVGGEWPTADTPWIAIDLDGDGAITSGAELFGDASVLPGGGTARNGFEALAAHDANQDGTIDRDDPAFASLLLWADRDGDRASTPDELRPLSEIVIAIPLAHHAETRCNERGACEGERGSLSWRDATGTEHRGAVIDVYLPRR